MSKTRKAKAKNSDLTVAERVERPEPDAADFEIDTTGAIAEAAPPKVRKTNRSQESGRFLKPVAAESNDEADLPDSRYHPDLDSTLEAPPAVAFADADETEEVAPAYDVKPKAPVAETPKHPGHLLRQAGEFGLTEADAAGMTTAELRDTINDLRQDALYRHQLQGGAKQTPAPEPEDEYLGLTDEYPTEVREAVKTLRGENKSLKKHLDNLLARDEQREIDAAVRRIDKGFESLGKEYEGIFGSGPVEELDPKGDQVRARALFVNSVPLDKRDPRFPEAMRRQAKLLYGALLANGPTVTVNQPAASGRPTKEEWVNGKAAPPTARKTKLKPGDERAAQHVARKLQEQGYGADGFGADEDDRLG